MGSAPTGRQPLPVTGRAPPTPSVNVLLVEDHPVVQLVVLEQLRGLGVDTQVAEDGEGALAAIRQRSFSLVLMDCHLPGLSGYETTRCIREREVAEGLPHTPVIAISIATDVEHLAKCMDCGMDGVLKKPLQPNELQNLLHLWTGVGSVSVQEPAPPFDPALGTELLYQAAIAEDLTALQAAVAAGDRAAGVHFAHRIRGAAWLAGAEAIAGCAAQLESSLAQSAVPGRTQEPSLLARLKAEVSRSYSRAP